MCAFCIAAEVPVAGPTFEDLTFDDTLNDLERLERYGLSHIALQRLVHVRLLSGIAREFGFEAIRDRMFPIIDDLVKDEEFVLRQHLAEQFRGVASACKELGGDEGYALVIRKVLPSLARLISDVQPEVRIAAGESLVSVAGWLKPSDLGTHVLTIVLHLAHDDEAEDLRMTAAVLLNEVASNLGPELCEQFVVPELTYLADDPVFRVRKAAALNLDAVCRVVGPSTSETKLLPAFLKLAKDDIWGVRKACAESIVSVSKSLSPEARAKHLIPLIETYLADASRWVRNAAFQHLGPFLATLPSEKVSSSLLSKFVAMAPGVVAPGASTAASISAVSDPELTIFCSFSFPAVALTLGRARWSELRPLFLVLARHPQKKVRRPLSHSLHELARILGPDITEKDLWPVFELYRRDVDDVRVGTVRHMAAFLAVLSPVAREARIPVLAETLESTPLLGWRFRRMIARQIDALAKLFSPTMVFAQVARLAERLLDDDVAAVRYAVASRLTPLLETVGAADAELREDIEGRLLCRAASSHASTRLCLIRALEAMAPQLPPDDFLGSFLATILRLSKDPVPLIRRRVAALFKRSTMAAAMAPAVTSGDASEVPRSSIPLDATPDRVVVKTSSLPAESPVKGAVAIAAIPDDDTVDGLDDDPALWPVTPSLAFLCKAPGVAAAMDALRADTDVEVRIALGQVLPVGMRKGGVPLPATVADKVPPPPLPPAAVHLASEVAPTTEMIPTEEASETAVSEPQEEP
jgi:serine/threonine-protein phosphatase 4 regulatory subunit 1